MVKGRIVDLQPFRSSDITPEYVGWLNDPMVVRYSNQRFRHHDASTCQTYLSSFSGTTNLFFAMRRGGVMVGTMTAYVSTPHGTADMGILVGDRNAWGKGVGSDAWITLMRHLLSRGDIRKVTGGAVRCNEGMVRIMQGSGMTPDGVRIAQELIDRQPHDVVHFAKFREAG
jgi:ribosomal-protein-alanine N-acetyltransferase